MSEPIKIKQGKTFRIAQPFYRRGVWAAVESESPLGHGVIHIPSGMKPPLCKYSGLWNGCTSDAAVSICRILADWDENFALDAEFGVPPEQSPPAEILDATCKVLDHDH